MPSVPFSLRIDAKIKKALKSDQRPAVSVKIAERHFGGPVIDPAAETELGKILQECGFRLVDEKSRGIGKPSA